MDVGRPPLARWFTQSVPVMVPVHATARGGRGRGGGAGVADGAVVGLASIRLAVKVTA